MYKSTALTFLLFSVGNYVFGRAIDDIPSMEKEYCSIKGFGNVSVGYDAFDDINCIGAICLKNQYQITHCPRVIPTKPNCQVKSPPGPFPECCPQVVCEDKNTLLL